MVRPIFRMGLINDGVGTKLDIEVLSGLVNVGVDHRRNGFQSPEDSDYNDKPNKFRVGNTDVYVGVGRKWNDIRGSTGSMFKSWEEHTIYWNLVYTFKNVQYFKVS